MRGIRANFAVRTSQTASRAIRERVSVGRASQTRVSVYISSRIVRVATRRTLNRRGSFDRAVRASWAIRALRQACLIGIIADRTRVASRSGRAVRRGQRRLLTVVIIIIIII